MDAVQQRDPGTQPGTDRADEDATERGGQEVQDGQDQIAVEVRRQNRRQEREQELVPENADVVPAQVEVRFAAEGVGDDQVGEWVTAASPVGPPALIRL